MLSRLLYFYTSLVDTILLAPLLAFCLRSLTNWTLTEESRDLLFGGDLGFVSAWMFTWVMLAAGQSLLQVFTTVVVAPHEEDEEDYE